MIPFIQIQNRELILIGIGGIVMKGYYTAEGYMGLVDGEYMLFACERDYKEYMEVQ